MPQQPHELAAERFACRIMTIVEQQVPYQLRLVSRGRTDNTLNRGIKQGDTSLLSALSSLRAS
jgi:hypothetical protein